ncbi:MAG: DUF5667 domain-containing protein [Anaerolineae bacterium]
MKSLLELVARLQVLREPPPPASLAAGRARFLAEAARLRQARSVRPSRQATGIVARPWGRLGTAVFRPALSLFIVIILFTFVGFTAQAASQSLPGSPLYPVKLAVERTQVALTFDPAAEARLEMTLAERRLSEVRLLAQTGRGPDVITLHRLDHQWNTSLQAIASAGDPEATALLRQALQVLSQERASLSHLLTQAAPEVQEKLTITLALTEETELAIRKALADPPEFYRTYGRPTATPAPSARSHSLKPGSSPTATTQPPPPTPSPTLLPPAPPTQPPATTRPPDTGEEPPSRTRKDPPGPPPAPTPTETPRPEPRYPTPTVAPTEPPPTPTRARPTRPFNPSPTQASTPTPTQASTPTWTPSSTPFPTPTSTDLPTREPTPTEWPTCEPTPTPTPTGVRLDPTPTRTVGPTLPPPTPEETPEPTPTVTPHATPRLARPTPPAFTPTARPTKPPPPTYPPPTYPPLPWEPTEGPDEPLGPTQT